MKRWICVLMVIVATMLAPSIASAQMPAEVQKKQVAVETLIADLQKAGAEEIRSFKALQTALQEKAPLAKIEELAWAYAPKRDLVLSAATKLADSSSDYDRTFDRLVRPPATPPPNAPIEDFLKDLNETQKYVVLFSTSASLRRRVNDSILATLSASILKEHNDVEYQAYKILDDEATKRLASLGDPRSYIAAGDIRACKAEKRLTIPDCYRRYIPNWPPK